ncbi:MAG: gas vesicle protein [Moritella dasanensis]|jgi:gas vesicle protein
MWENIKSLLGSSAPLIGTLIGGPAGAAVGGLVANALGVENTPVAIERALQNNPDAMVAIKKLESEERISLKQLALQASAIALDERKAELADTQNARTSHKDHWMPSAMTIILAVMVTGMFGALFAFEPPKNYDQVIIMTAGSVLGAFGTAVAFWLGSSRSSADKTKQLKGG